MANHDCSTPSVQPETCALRKPPPTPTHPDARLLTACDAFLALEERASELLTLSADDTSLENATNSARAPLIAAQDTLLDTICADRVVTQHGHAARCRVILACDRDLDPERDAAAGVYAFRRLLAATLRDLVAGGAA